MDDGKPQSIYRLETEGMERIGLASLRPGESYDFTVGSITFDSFVPWINLQVIHDPGKSYALAGGLLSLLGALGMLFVHRRRIWIRSTPEGIEIAGLCTTNEELVVREIEEVMKAMNTMKMMKEVRTDG